MRIIVAADKNWAIGNRGNLLVKIPADMKRFQQLTMGKTIVMGRKTLESLPAGMPLAGRTNIILTNQKDYKVRGGIVVHSFEEAKEKLQKLSSEEVYIIGGQSVYEQFLPLADEVWVTKIDYEYEADTKFPNMDQMEEWMLCEESEEQIYFDIEYYFLKYSRKP